MLLLAASLKICEASIILSRESQTEVQTRGSPREVGALLESLGTIGKNKKKPLSYIALGAASGRYTTAQLFFRQEYDV